MTRETRSSSPRTLPAKASSLHSSSTWPGCTRRTGATPPKVQASSSGAGRYLSTSTAGSLLVEHALGLQDAARVPPVERDQVDHPDHHPDPRDRPGVPERLGKRGDEAEHRDSGS